MKRKKLLTPLAALMAATLLAACSSSSTTTNSPSPAPSSHAGAHSSSATAPTAPPLRPGEEFVDLSVAEPYTPSPPNGGTDDYRCFIIDPKVTGPKFLTGVQFKPQSTAMAHHAITFLVSPEKVAQAHAKDAASPGQGWTCFGNDGLDDSTWADTWTPGVGETLLKVDGGYPVVPGSLLVLQVHYNLLEKVEQDKSGLRLRLTKGTATTKALATAPLSAPIELPCTAEESGPLCDRAASVADVKKRFGEEGGMVDELVEECSNGKVVPGNTQRCDHVLPVGGTVYAARGHMHLLGSSIKVELNPGTAKSRLLLDVPQFNFDDQALHELPAPVTLKAGDVLRVTCTHDASLRKTLPQLQNLPPRYVTWGDGSSDEMCLGLLTVSTPANS